MSIWTVEEIDEQIALRKEWLKSGRQSYGITPASGGASRNATNLTRAEILQELHYFNTMKSQMEGSAPAPRNGPTTSHATFNGSGSTVGRGDPYP